MTVVSYLNRLASQAIIRDQEKESIDRSISALRTKISRYFGEDLARHLIFGSYSRGTILPRSMDRNSDVDYMLVFSNSSHRPQTYLDRLRRFVERNYNRSEIKQSHPTIVLSLNHIRFELVPAVDHWLAGLRIPAKADGLNDWISTDPTGFNAQLTSANRAEQNLIKPLVRIVKYWNAVNDYPFYSFELEQKVVDHNFGFFGLFIEKNLKEYFFEFMEELEAGIFDARWKKEAVSRAKRVIETVKEHEQHLEFNAAENAIKRLLPPTAGMG